MEKFYQLYQFVQTGEAGKGAQKRRNDSAYAEK